MTGLVAEDDAILLTLEETAAILRISRTHAYRLASGPNPTIQTLRLGATRRVSRVWLERFIAQGSPAR